MKRLWGYIKWKASTIRNRIRAFRKSPAWNTFVGVFWALVAVEAMKALGAGKVLTAVNFVLALVGL